METRPIENGKKSHLSIRTSSANPKPKSVGSLRERICNVDKTLVFALAIIILVGLVPLTWYRPGQIIISGDDSGYWFNSPNTFFGDMNVWAGSEGVGHVSRMPSLVALFLPMYVMQSLSIANGVTQVMLYAFLLVLSGLTMFHFLWTLVGKKPLAILVGSLFYMLSVIFVVNIISLVIIWAHAFLPLMLTLFFKLIQKRVRGEPSKKLLAVFVFSFSVIMSFLADSPPILIIALASIVVIFIYLSLTLKFLKVTRQTILVIGSAILASLWWIIPLALTTLQVISAPGQSISSGSLADSDFRSSFLNWFWLMPAWKWQPMYYPYINSYYTNPIVILATFIPILLVAVGLFFNQKNKGMQYLFFGVLLVGMFIGKGTHPPFPQVYDFLTAHIPMFGSLFREPENKFGVMIALFASVLIAFTMDSLINVTKRFQRPKGKLAGKIVPTLLVSLVSLTIVISAGPMFTGEATDTGYSPQGAFSSYVRVPDYWNQASQYFANDSSDYRVLVAPDSPYLYMGYTWGYWGADCVPLRLIQKPVLYNTYGYQTNAADIALNLTYQTIESRNYTALDNLLSCLNIKYILVRNDLAMNYSVYPVTPPADIENSLGNYSKVQLVQSYGLLDIYENKNWSPTHFFASTIPLDGNTTELLTKNPLEKSNQIQLNSVKVSASEYKVFINATQPVYLFFSEGYDSGWKVTGADAEWYSIPFTGNCAGNHTVALEFGNEWYISKIGSYELTVTYTPESYFLYAVVLTVIASFSIIICALLYFFVKSRGKRRIA